ncbi:hypothetical protein EV207_1439 [Scopulibacillus darangshiensis]|uniref:Uncharacterized protein n=1 Tax=Scopulibacillus darangshiensis TaxID=442528 RepID=A0A4R2NJ41_9BACL|nr:hypothetical protein [Scopulibacillus darangshiensis]TCP21332.1 hypothetical protein EV207_1439 [Scopulibacillus darangshiensis]
MSNKMERILAYIASGWQLLDGIITIFIYGTYIRNKGSHISGLSFEEKKGLESLFGSIYSFVSTYGILLILLGLMTIYMTRTYLKNDSVPKRVPIWFLICGVVSYFTMDIISLVLYMGAAILILAKNRSIKIHTRLNKFKGEIK